MDALNQYGSSDESDDGRGGAPRYAEPVARQYRVDTAPDIAGCVPGADELVAYVAPGQKEIRHNLAHSVLAQPLAGPVDSEGQYARRAQLLSSGQAEQQAVDELSFRQQERQFRQRGCANDPSAGAEGRTVGSAAAAAAAPSAAGPANNRGLRRKARGDPAVLEGDNAYRGPWAGYEGEARGEPTGPSPEQLAAYEEQKAQHADGDGDGGSGGAAAATKARAKGRARSGYEAGQDERTVLHSASERDYQGRTYMHVPTELRHGEIGDQRCYAPKRMVREWRAHAGGVSAIRFLPDSGHLLLSSGMDGTVKIHDTHASLRTLRTFIGHAKAVRDISFAPDGRTFLSSSYDATTKLWDTETGQCRQRFAADGKVPYVARFYPEDPNLFLVGQSDKKIVQWDARANEIVQEYNQHLGAINSLTFIDGNRRFVSTSDDKSMRVWEFGIPVVIKLVADPSMHSVPAVALHPSQKWFVGQSMDNRIVVYSAGERIKPHRRKEFAGHLTAGFACQPAFSPDGRVLVSGDAEGGVWCWDWQTARVVERWRGHDKVTIGAAWHPREASRVATCSWDGTIKYWE
ncbi:hypothetical protein H4R18_001342 [Coemansia javaensis]|uniref:Pre-mRNA-processing factor 17 n=1 Tax=Coemansia javaensis TaxID=2761396 RepID=A0A9W8HFF0_9FUNG|nr:hypothetical protein H4R18_001342 [Coemansia javaensis]